MYKCDTANIDKKIYKGFFSSLCNSNTPKFKEYYVMNLQNLDNLFSEE